VCALGAGNELVGVSHECDFPAGVAENAVLTRARLRPPGSHGASSRAIDAEVRAVLEDALAVYEVEIDRLRTSEPSVIVTQDLCDVCAVSLDDVRAAVARLGLEGVEIVNLHPTLLGDIWSDVQRVADALDRADEGRRVVADLRARVEAISGRAACAAKRPAVLSVEWIDPVMIAGMWMPELIELAGGAPMVTAAGDHAPTLSLEALRALDPEVVVIKPCGFTLARTMAEVDVLRATLPWDAWRAVREGRVYAADGNAYFNRPGPRIVESLEILAACVHPELFPDFTEKHAAAMRRL
jgi:iron complex transport system substrate-binding protein